MTARYRDAAKLRLLGRVISVPFIYAAPFIVVSSVSFLCCLAIRRLRRYALQAMISPLAFGVCSITGMLFIVLTADLFHQRSGLLAFPGPLVGLKGVLVGLLIYFTPGIAGSWVVTSLVRRFKQGLHP
jgi:hypothetical protein